MYASNERTYPEKSFKYVSAVEATLFLNPFLKTA